MLVRVFARELRGWRGWRRAPTLGTMPVHDPDDSVPSNDFGHRADLATRRANSRGTSRAADGDGDSTSDCDAGTKDDGGEASTQSSTNANEADHKEDDNADEVEDFDDEEEEEEEEEVHGIVDYIMGKRGSVAKGTRQ